MKRVALLRGINVSGKNIIRMNDLKNALEEEGYRNVSSYLQSGNVLLQTETGVPSLLESQISEAVLRRFGLNIEVIVRTPGELLEVESSTPFAGNSNVYVTFFKTQPENAEADLSRHLQEGEAAVFGNKCIYFQCGSGYGKSGFSNNFIERKFGVIATTRNMKTVSRLAELANNKS